MSDLAPQSFITKKKFKNKPAKGEKLINFTKDDTSSICDKYRNGASSTLPGDGSCLHVHASCYGHKVQDALDLDNNYRFSAQDADIGWDK